MPKKDPDVSWDAVVESLQPVDCVRARWTNATCQKWHGAEQPTPCSDDAAYLVVLHSPHLEHPVNILVCRTMWRRYRERIDFAPRDPPAGPATDVVTDGGHDTDDGSADQAPPDFDTEIHARRPPTGVFCACGDLLTRATVDWDDDAQQWVHSPFGDDAHTAQPEGDR